MGPFGLDRGGWIGGFVEKEVGAAEAGIALTALRVEDPEDRPPPRRAVAIAGDERLRPLADDVAPQPDPRPPGEFQAQAGRLGHGGREAAGRTTGQPGWLEDDEERLRPTGECRQPAEPVRDPGRTVRRGEPASGQVQDEQVHRATGEQRATDGQAFVEGLRGDDDEPLEPDAARDGLDRVETPRKVEPGDDRAGRLGLRREPQDERGSAARTVAADRDARRTRQATRPQDRVERGEPGVDDAVIDGRGRETGRVRGRETGRVRGRVRSRRGRQGERPIRDPRSCRSPASLEARYGCRHVRGEGRHRMLKIEHPFE